MNYVPFLIAIVMLGAAVYVVWKMYDSKCKENDENIARMELLGRSNKEITEKLNNIQRAITDTEIKIKNAKENNIDNATADAILRSIKL